jgi:hypothetical protein
MPDGTLVRVTFVGEAKAKKKARKRRRRTT